MAYSNPPAPQRPLRVCLVVPYDLAPQAGGVKQHSLQLKAALERAGDVVTLVGPTSDPTFAQHDPKRGMHAFAGVVQVPVNGTLSAVGMKVSPRALYRFFRAHEFDVVHLQEPQVPTMAWGICWLQRQLPKVATFHAADENDSIPWMRKFTGAALFWAIERGITVSPAAEKRTRQSWPRPLAVIPNGVDTKTFYPAPEATPRQPGPLRLVYVGRLADKRKGARVLLSAYAALRRERQDVELLMVGEAQGFGPRPELPGLRYAEGLSNEELAAAFRHSDALVAPATGQESFGMILVEAMACGKPVVCSDIPGYMGVVRRKGAVVAPPGDAVGLAAAIEQLLALPAATRAEMGAHNAVYAQRYAWDTLVHDVRREYAAAIAAKRGRSEARGLVPGVRRP